MRRALTLCAALSVTLGASAHAVNLAQVTPEEVCYSSTLAFRSWNHGVPGYAEQRLAPLAVQGFEEQGFLPFADLPGSCRYLLAATATLDNGKDGVRVSYEFTLDPLPFQLEAASNAWVARSTFPFVSNAATAKSVDAAFYAALKLFIDDWRDSRDSVIRR